MGDERKIAVYLSKLDWQAVIGCLLSHIERERVASDPVWTVGRNRIRYIVDEIVAKQPKDANKT